MSQPTEHVTDPNTIPVGSVVRFDCPSTDCDFHFWKHWQVSDGKAFGDRHCRLHEGLPLVMLITEVTAPTDD